jgi:hemoglobin-like flavoprotein
VEWKGLVARPEVHADAVALRRGWWALSLHGKELHEAHKDLRITSEEFDEVGAEIASALDDVQVPERETQDVLAAIVAHKAEVATP